MNKYITDGCRSVTAENMSDAASEFANRIARKTFGKTAYARTCNRSSWNSDNTVGGYDAFIGYTPTGKHNLSTTVGKNIMFHVYRVG